MRSGWLYLQFRPANPAGRLHRRPSRLLKNTAELAAAGSVDLRLPMSRSPGSCSLQLNSSGWPKNCGGPDPGRTGNVDWRGQKFAVCRLAGERLAGAFGLLKWCNGRLAVFCPLFAAFIRQFKSPQTAAVLITVVAPNQARLKTAAGEEQLTLSPLLFACCCPGQSRPGQLLPPDMLISQIYRPDAVGVSNAALSQLVKRLRQALDRPSGDCSLTRLHLRRDHSRRRLPAHSQLHSIPAA